MNAYTNVIVDKKINKTMKWSSNLCKVNLCIKVTMCAVIPDILNEDMTLQLDKKSWF